MGHFFDAFRAIATVAKSFIRPPATVQFPQEIRPRAERLRASFALVHEENGDEACIGCLQCERICPSKVISIKGPAKRDSPITGKKRSYADDFTLDLSACIFCELCVQVCPADAIVMTREQEVPAFSREDLVLTMPKLYANEKSKTRAWGDATKLNAMQAIPKPPAAAVPAVAAPAVAAPAVAAPAVTAPAVAAPAVVAPAVVAPVVAAPAVAPPVTPSGVEGTATATQALSPTLSPAGERETVSTSPAAAPVPETKP